MLPLFMLNIKTVSAIKLTLNKIYTHTTHTYKKQTQYVVVFAKPNDVYKDIHFENSNVPTNPIYNQCRIFQTLGKMRFEIKKNNQQHYI